MTDTPVKVEVCCDPACENYNQQQVVPLTAEEIAQIEADAAKFAEEQAAREAAEAAKAEAKASAEAKLAALGLTSDEVKAILG